MDSPLAWKKVFSIVVLLGAFQALKVSLERGSFCSDKYHSPFSFKESSSLLSGPAENNTQMN